MKVILLLCDYVQKADSKMNIIGAGWSVRGAGTSPMGLAVKIDVPWNEANRPHQFKLALYHEDGEIVTISSPLGDQNVEIAGQLEVGRPPGIPEGTPLDTSIAINMQPFPLQVGRYEWRMEINGSSQADWHASFLVRGAPDEASS